MNGKLSISKEVVEKRNHCERLAMDFDIARAGSVQWQKKVTVNKDRNLDGHTVTFNG